MAKVQQEQGFTFRFTQKTLDVILSGLGELKLKDGIQALRVIEMQLHEQLRQKKRPKKGQRADGI